jgi:invasion protein IalB
MAHTLTRALFRRAGFPLVGLAAGLLLATSAIAAGTPPKPTPAPAAPAAAPAPAPAPAIAPAPAVVPAPAAAAGGDQSAWVKVCSTDPTSKKELCEVVQELHAQTGQFIAAGQIQQITGDAKIMFIAAVPIAMLLQPGLRIQVDTGKQFDGKYIVCIPTACYAQLPIDVDFINAMKNGKQVVITAMSQQQKAVSFPLSLAGFTKVYDGKGIDPQQAQKQQDDLNKALQARAEDARKKLLEQQQKESGTPPAPATPPAQ